VVCYIERIAGGSLIRRVRLVGDGGPTGLDRSWNAPALTGGGGGGGAGGGTAGAGEGGQGGVSSNEAVAHTKAAARWVADSLNTLGTKRLAMLCVDPDGAVCTWLSAPSADASVIQATLAQPDTEGDGGTAGGAARLLALGAGSSAGFTPGEASVQALATLERPSGGGTAMRGRGKASLSGRRERFAVLAVPDAPVRVFLDELDERGIEVDQVISLWHALAMAWDPGRQDVEDGGGASDRVVASQSPSAAIVAVDPLGRLVWAWSQSGQLVAGGTMRLRTVAPAARPADVEETPEGADAAGTRRVGGTGGEAPLSIEFTPADTGRLVLDWLSWSAQLGHCPQRVACIGPAPVPAGAGAESQPDPALIGQSLGEAWPGATVGVAIHNDPVGATLQRLLTYDIAQSNRRAADLAVATGSDDPRGAMVSLSSRPGRLDRRMHTWVAIGVAGVAVVVGAIGWQLRNAAGKADEGVETANARRKGVIADMADVIPGIAASTNPRADLEAEIERLTKQNNSIKAPRPLLQEVAALLNSIGEHEDVKIDRFDLNPITGVVNLRVPDAETGPAIQEKLEKQKLFMKWTGSTPGGVAAADGMRRYNLQGLAATDSRSGGGN
jgi:hypothetical protein